MSPGQNVTHVPGPYPIPTRQHYLLNLHRLLHDLAAAGHPRQPGLILTEDLPPRPHYLPRALSPEDDHLLQQQLRRTDDQFSNALLLTRATGIRIGECICAKSVRNIAGVVSSAFSRAIKWGLITTNPITNSEPPKVKKHHSIAFTPAQQKMAIESATSPWCLRTYLKMVAATGCRRGEMLALRWADQDGRAMITRSLTQTWQLLEFKCTKTEEPRPVSLPVSAIAALQEHRKRQDEFHRQYGPEYRADLDLIFANTDGSPLKPDSISAAVSLLFRRRKLPKDQGQGG